jgi:hypothetical protein
MIFEIILATFGLFIFFLTGLTASYFLFHRVNIIERTVYTIILSVILVTFAGYIFFIFNIQNQFYLLLFVCLVLLVLSFILLKKSKTHPKLFKTFFDIEIIFIALFSVLGSIWRYLFVFYTNNHLSPYAYSKIYQNGEIPDLGFYTGMVKSHANYIGKDILVYLFEYLHINLGMIEIFISVFVSLSLIYLVFMEYKQNKKLAYIAISIMALGPIEKFYNTNSFYGHAFSMFGLLLLFLYFKSKDQRIFWLAFLVAIYNAITYYTGTAVAILASAGFIASSFAKDWFLKKSFLLTSKNILLNKKLIGFFVILIITTTYLFIASNMSRFTISSSKNTENISFAIQNIGYESNGHESEATISDSVTYDSPASKINTSNFYKSTVYKDRKILWFSAMGWQSLFFLLCGSTFIIYLLWKRKISNNSLDILLAIIPVSFVSFGFFYMNYPARIFNYFAFFSILALKIPKKYYKIFGISALIFISITCMCIASDKMILWENPEGEINGANEISQTMSGKIFSDQRFVQNLIFSNYYKVTGTKDNDPILIGLFYSNNEKQFLSSLEKLKKNNVKYIATTKRMRESYILMLNYPIKKMINPKMYDKYLEKVYDNGDVRVYDIEYKDNSQEI